MSKCFKEKNCLEKNNYSPEIFNVKCRSDTQFLKIFLSHDKYFPIEFYVVITRCHACVAFARSWPLSAGGNLWKTKRWKYFSQLIAALRMTGQPCTTTSASSATKGSKSFDAIAPVTCSYDTRCATPYTCKSQFTSPKETFDWDTDFSSGSCRNSSTIYCFF